LMFDKNNGEMLKLLDLVDMVNRSNANGHRITEVWGVTLVHAAVWVSSRARFSQVSSPVVSVLWS
jgi:hypothetical protein